MRDVLLGDVRSLDIRDRNRLRDVLLHLLSAAAAEYQCLHRDRRVTSHACDRPGRAALCRCPLEAVPPPRRGATEA
jgi:hypothetical protein